MRRPKVQTAKAGRRVRRYRAATPAAKAALRALATAARITLSPLPQSVGDAPKATQSSPQSRISPQRLIDNCSCRRVHRGPNNSPPLDGGAMHRSAAFLSFAAIAGLGLVSACGTTSGTSSSGGGTGLAGCHGTITVATDLPLTGGDATDGPFPQLAAALAVSQANTNHTLGGCTLKYVSKDDSSVLKNGHD